MVLQEISITWSELLAIIIGIPTAITIPLTVFLTRIKSNGDQNHKCLERLEKKIDDMKINFRSELIEEEKANTSVISDIKTLNLAIGRLDLIEKILMKIVEQNERDRLS